MPRPGSPHSLSLFAETARLAGESTDETDFEALYRQHAETVAHWAVRLGGPLLDYEDVVHEVFLKLQRALPQLDATKSLNAWLYRVTLNEVRYRRRKARIRHFLSGLAGDFAANVRSEAPVAPELLERQEEARRVHAALDRLPEKFREVLVLFELEGRSGEEVAALMGARLATVWVWLGRARARLARELKTLEGES